MLCARADRRAQKEKPGSEAVETWRGRGRPTPASPGSGAAEEPPLVALPYDTGIAAEFAPPPVPSSARGSSRMRARAALKADIRAAAPPGAEHTRPHRRP